MTEPTPANHNTAEYLTGFQGSVVHNSNVYIAPPGASPHERYKVGANNLAINPRQAKATIDDAIARGCDDSRVRFHWVLAILSNKSHRDVDRDERAQLENLWNVLDHYDDDEWHQALTFIRDIVDLRNSVAGDPSSLHKRLEALPALQREELQHHLDRLLNSELKDAFWEQQRQSAAENQLSEQRNERAWKYFQPKPEKPRARPPEPDATTPGDRVAAVAWSLLFLLAAGSLGWSALVRVRPVAVLALVCAIAAVTIALRSGSRWFYHVGRLRRKEHVYAAPNAAHADAGHGFAAQVTSAFEHYSRQYAPHGTSQHAWLRQTSGFRAALRDELVEIYRESRINPGRINWLIRALVWDLGNRWRRDTLFDYREQHRTSASTKAWCAGALAVALPAVVSTVVEAFRVSPLATAAAVAACAGSAYPCVRRWLDIVSERWRYAEDSEECDRRLAERWKAYERWQAKLADRPSDAELEHWLSCDKHMLLAEGLRHYDLAWRDIIAYAFLQTPANGAKRARERGGPWRYSRYDLRLFLVTHDGVREIGTELDTYRGAFSGRERNNFRFDAISSVHVTESTEDNHTLELSLMHGSVRNIHVETPATDPEAGPDDSDLAELNLNVSGFARTLHVLEGIAAEGKGWTWRDPLVNS